MEKSDWKNEVILTGYLVHDPELKISKNGVSICKATLRNSKGVKGEDGRYISNFFQLTAFREEADELALLHDKDIVTIYGKLIQDTWEKEGQKRSAVSVIVNEHVVNSYADKQSGKEEEIDPFADENEEGIGIDAQASIVDRIVNHLHAKGIDYSKQSLDKKAVLLDYKTALIRVLPTGHIQVSGKQAAKVEKLLDGLIPAVP